MRHPLYLALACAACLALSAAGCTRPADVSDDDETLPDSLVQLGLFEGELRQLVPAPGVRPYTINSTSFYDYADSSLVMKLPPGTSIQYRGDGPFEFPVGTILAQTLSYADDGYEGGRKLVETRVLLRRSDRWIAVPYVWNDEQTEASFEILGARIPVSRRLPDGTVHEQMHVVPNFNDCKRCHRIGDIVTPIAAGVRQLNCPPPGGPAGEDQLAGWQRDGLLLGLPSGGELPRLVDWKDPSTGTVERRARAWLEANCAHCHNPRGTARNSGLQLAAEIEEPSMYGVLKTPVAAGRGSGGLSFDIMPGRPKLSIMLYRVRSTEPGTMMPEFGRAQVDEEGAALLSQWIALMPPAESLAEAGIVGIVSELSPEEATAWATDALAEGDVQRGAAVFGREALNCTKCHAIDGKGANVGPDLAKMGADMAKTGAEFNAQHVVESILLPNKVIKEGFRAVTVQTESGQVITGIQVLDDGHEIVLRDPVRGDTHISKAEIAARAEGESLMPAQVVVALKREEFLDLVRYLFELSPPTASAETAPASER